MKRRSSILKPAKSRAPLGELGLGGGAGGGAGAGAALPVTADDDAPTATATDVTRTRRVSFSATKGVALFTSEVHGNTIWHDIFEVSHKPELSDNSLSVSASLGQQVDNLADSDNKQFNTTFVNPEHLEDNDDLCIDISAAINNLNGNSLTSQMQMTVNEPTMIDHTEALINFKICQNITTNETEPPNPGMDKINESDVSITQGIPLPLTEYSSKTTFKCDAVVSDKENCLMEDFEHLNRQHSLPNVSIKRSSTFNDSPDNENFKNTYNKVFENISTQANLLMNNFNSDQMHSELNNSPKISLLDMAEEKPKPDSFVQNKTIIDSENMSFTIFNPKLFNKSVTQGRRTILFENNEDANMSLTMICPEGKENENDEIENNIQKFDRSERRKTLAFDPAVPSSDMSMTCAVINPHVSINNSMKIINPELSNMNISMKRSTLKRQTVVFDSDHPESNMSMTMPIRQSVNFPEKSENHDVSHFISEKTQLGGNMSMTMPIRQSVNFTENSDNHKKSFIAEETQLGGNMSMTVPILSNSDDKENINKSRRKTIVFDQHKSINDMSMTCANPGQIQKNPKSFDKTVSCVDMSMTKVVEQRANPEVSIANIPLSSFSESVINLKPSIMPRSSVFDISSPIVFHQPPKKLSIPCKPVVVKEKLGNISLNSILASVIQSEKMTEESNEPSPQISKESDDQYFENILADINCQNLPDEPIKDKSFEPMDVDVTVGNIQGVRSLLLMENDIHMDVFNGDSPVLPRLNSKENLDLFKNSTNDDKENFSHKIHEQESFISKKLEDVTNTKDMIPSFSINNCSLEEKDNEVQKIEIEQGLNIEKIDENCVVETEGSNILEKNEKSFKIDENLSEKNIEIENNVNATDNVKNIVDESFASEIECPKINNDFKAIESNVSNNFDAKKVEILTNITTNNSASPDKSKIFDVQPENEKYIIEDDTSSKENLVISNENKENIQNYSNIVDRPERLIHNHNESSMLFHSDNKTQGMHTNITLSITGIAPFEDEEMDDLATPEKVPKCIINSTMLDDQVKRSFNENKSHLSLTCGDLILNKSTTLGPAFYENHLSMKSFNNKSMAECNKDVSIYNISINKSNVIDEEMRKMMHSTMAADNSNIVDMEIKHEVCDISNMPKSFYNITENDNLLMHHSNLEFKLEHITQKDDLLMQNLNSESFQNKTQSFLTHDISVPYEDIVELDMNADKSKRVSGEKRKSDILKDSLDEEAAKKIKIGNILSDKKPESINRKEVAFSAVEDIHVSITMQSENKITSVVINATDAIECNFNVTEKAAEISSNKSVLREPKNINVNEHSTCENKTMNATNAFKDTVEKTADISSNKSTHKKFENTFDAIEDIHVSLLANNTTQSMCENKTMNATNTEKISDISSNKSTHTFENNFNAIQDIHASLLANNTVQSASKNKTINAFEDDLNITAKVSDISSNKSTHGNCNKNPENTFSAVENIQASLIVDNTIHSVHENKMNMTAAIECNPEILNCSSDKNDTGLIENISEISLVNASLHKTCSQEDPDNVNSPGVKIYSKNTSVCMSDDSECTNKSINTSFAKLKQPNLMEIIEDLNLNSEDCEIEVSSGNEWSFLLFWRAVRLKIVFEKPVFVSTNMDEPIADISFHEIYMKKSSKPSCRFHPLGLKMAFNYLKLHSNSNECRKSGNLPEFLKHCASISQNARNWCSDMFYYYTIYGVDLDANLLTFKIMHPVKLRMCCVEVKLDGLPYADSSNISVSVICGKGISIDEIMSKVRAKELKKNWNCLPRLIEHLNNIIFTLS